MHWIIALFHAAHVAFEALWQLVPAPVADGFFLVGLFITGAAASFINMLSGGGSMIVLGYMMLLGVDPLVANATNRIGVFASTASGAAAYGSERFTDIKESLRLGAWSIPGAIAGAMCSLAIEAIVYQRILAAVMILVTASMFMPKKKEHPKEMPFRGKLVYPAMLAVGFYGGAIQVGVGIFIYALLRHLSNMELMRINMHRVFIVLIFIIPSVGVFIWSGKINWLYAAALCAGNAAGSWATVKWTLKTGDKSIKIGFALFIGLMAIRLFFW